MYPSADLYLKEWRKINDALVRDLGRLSFSSPVAHVYNPLEYAREAYDGYLQRYGVSGKRVVFLGMNPGPWGMVQTGIPFGEVAAVREWLGIDHGVGAPAREHPRRPVTGFDCPRSEVSGRRLWGWARGRFGTPERFFAEHFVANYCPLAFMEESGRNRTPDKLPRGEREALYAICDEGLRRAVRLLEPQWVVGIGQFALTQASRALEGVDIQMGAIAHPSPANPSANRGWEPLVDGQLGALGIILAGEAQDSGAPRSF